MVTTTAAFRTWLKGNLNMKLSSDASVLRLTHEGITSLDSLTDFDAKAIKLLPKVCKDNIDAIVADVPNGIAAENAVNGANISSISVQRLIVAADAARYYQAIDRTPTTLNMHYTNVLKVFKLEWEAYEAVKSEDDPKIPKINDRDGDRKVIRWAPIFLDALENTHGARGPLRYVLREDPIVPPEASDPLPVHDPLAGIQGAYYGSSGSLIGELLARLPHTGPIYKSDNAAVYMKVEEATRGTSCESTIKAFSRRKDGRGAYLALVANHAGDVKYRAISKKRQNLLQNIKWTGMSYPLETHVSNHRQAFDDIRECSLHITVPVPSEPQRVEYLIDSVSSKDTTLQAAIGIIRANTNNMRNDFEAASTSLIEVDPYRRSTRQNNNRDANVSAIDFGAGRGSTGVDLRFHPKDKFVALPQDQKDELREWLSTHEGKQSKKEFFQDRNGNKSDKDNKRKGDNNAGGNWKKKLKNAMKTEKGLKAVFAILGEEESSNQTFASALSTVALPPAPVSQAPPIPPATATAASASIGTVFPATSLKLRSILKKK
jgi:hypothetical protein